MKVTIDIHDNFAGVLSITAAKSTWNWTSPGMNATTYVVDLSKGTELRIDEAGKGWQSDYKFKED